MLCWELHLIDILWVEASPWACNRLLLTHLTPVCGVLYVKASCLSESVGQCDTHNWSFEMLNVSSTLNNWMLFSLVVPNMKGNRTICLGLKWIWKKPSGNTRFPLGTSYFCPGSDWSLILWCNKAHPDERNCMWPWWMTFVKSPIAKCITNQLINSFTISMHLRFCRCFFLSTQFKGKICQFVGCRLSRRAVSFWCPRGTYAVLSESPLENAALVYVNWAVFPPSPPLV